MRRLTTGHLKAGIRSVRSTKLRSFWTMLGVIIGVASVITVVGIGEGVKQQISGQIHHMGNNIIAIRPAAISAGSNSANTSLDLAGLGVSSVVTDQDIRNVAHVKGVTASAPLTIVSGTVTAGNGVYKNGYVIGTTPDLSSLLNQSLAYGTFLSSDQMGTNTAVLGQAAANAMFSESVPLGQVFTLHGQQFIVSGIFNQFNTAPLSQQIDLDNAIFIPDDVAESLTNNTAPTYEILARAMNGAQAPAVAARIHSVLNADHGGQGNFSVLRGNQNITSSDYVLELLTRLIAGVAAISLLVGGIGIMNVMLVSVTERMHEIGIRKAVGATNRQILNQFMIEATVLSLVGGIIGVIVALVVDAALQLFTDLKPQISWQVVVGAVIVSLLVGVIFGTAPALKAARKDPIEALRSE